MGVSASTAGWRVAVPHDSPVDCCTYVPTRLDSGSSRSFQNIEQQDSSISGDRWQLSLLLSTSLPCLVDLRQMSDAKSALVFLLIFFCHPESSSWRHLQAWLLPVLARGQPTSVSKAWRLPAKLTPMRDCMLLVYSSYLHSGLSHSCQNLGRWDSSISVHNWSLATIFPPLHVTPMPCRSSPNVRRQVVCGLRTDFCPSSGIQFMATFDRLDFRLSRHVACQPQSLTVHNVQCTVCV